MQLVGVVRSRLARAAVAGLLAVFVGTAAMPAHASEAEPVSASALVGPCTPQAAVPPAKLGELLHSCKGTAVVSGTWTGTLRYRAEGNVGIVSGDARGRIHEWFRGRSEDGRRGELYMSGTYTVDGETGVGVSTLRIDRGTQDFARATGTVVVNGTMPITGGPEIADFEGTWRPQG
jgi:hypothetical protein